MRIVYILLFVVLAIFSNKSIAQNKYSDSLLKVYNNTMLNDTIRLKAMSDLAWNYVFSNPDSAILLSKMQIQFSIKKNKSFWQADGYNTIGVSYYISSNYSKALDYFNRSIEIKKKINDKKGIAASLSNVGSIYFNESNYSKALDCYFESMKIEEELKNYEGLAQSYNDIGVVYQETAEFIDKEYYLKKALSYFNKSFELSKKHNNKYSQAAALGNIGTIYHDKNDIPKALKYQFECLNLRKEINDKQGEAASYGNIGNIYLELKTDQIKKLNLEHNQHLKLAIKYYEQCNEIMQELHDLNGLALSRTNLSKAYFKLGEYQKAEQMAREGLNFAKELNLVDLMRDNHFEMYNNLLIQKNYKEAVYHLKEYLKYKDSLDNEEDNKLIARKEMRFEYEKKALSDSLKHAEEKAVVDAKLAARDAKIKQEQTFRYSLIFGLLILISFALFIYNRFRVTRNQKIIIEEQKILVEEKNQAITDSIVYAKRLQDAILPSEKNWMNEFPNSFILYRPKDIVAGDFYFLEKTETHLIFAVADCTGHGVPGAMVSVVCHNALIRAVKEFNLVDANEILDKVRSIVLETFEKSETDVKDGMDISLCVIQLNNGKIKWAGANNPLWIYKKSTSSIVELKPDKQPIGKVYNYVPFHQHEIVAEKGDRLYLFTDGYADQFGLSKEQRNSLLQKLNKQTQNKYDREQTKIQLGKGKKLKYSALQKLIVENAHMKIADQKLLLEDYFNEWKGQLEQVDDVCLVGIEF